MPHQLKTLQSPDSQLHERARRVRRRLAAGQLGAGEAVDELVSVLYGDDYAASMLAIELMRLEQDERAVVPLIETVFWSDAEDAHMTRALRCAAIDALAAIAPDDDMVVGTLVAATRDPDPIVACAAIAALGASIGQAGRALVALQPCLAHREAGVRRAAQLSLQRLLRAKSHAPTSHGCPSHASGGVAAA